MLLNLIIFDHFRNFDNAVDSLYYVYFFHHNILQIIVTACFDHTVHVNCCHHIHLLDYVDKVETK